MGFSRQEYWSGVPLPSPITFIWKYKKWKLTYSDKELISVCWGKRKWREGGINMRHEETFGDGDRFIILIEVIFSQMYTCVKIHPTLCAVSVQFSWSVMSNSLWPHGLQHARLPCPSSTPRACSNSCPSSQWCHPVISSSSLHLLPSIFPSNRVFSNESVLCIRWPKDWSFSFSISPCNEYSGLISFRIDWFDLLAVQGILKSHLQHHS